ncbi:MAG: CAP domain-containing protein [Oscillospiraceae bacterium]|nr:CAP domain-containing protein [Oscillospiraceae bacterium]
MKKILTVLIALLLLAQALPALAAAPEEPAPEAGKKFATTGEAVAYETAEADGPTAEKTAEEGTVRAAAAGTVSGRSSVAKPTMDELRQQLEAIPEITDLYTTGSSIAAEDYHPAVLSPSARANALAWINYFRTAAGLTKVSFTDALNLSASWGALVLAMGDQFTHWPQLPEGMSDADFEKGYDATTQSNISYCGGYESRESLRVAVWGQIEDRDEYNVEVLGHRRWLLDPRTKTMGVGSAESDKYYADLGLLEYYTDIRVFGDGVGTQSATDYDFISWPASGNNISETFACDVPWSVTLNPARYAAPDRSKVQVKLTRKSDGKVWTFSSKTDVSNVGPDYDFFNVDNDGYGIDNCIVFRPSCKDFTYYDGEYSVDVTGIYDSAGKAAALHYTVLFAPYKSPAFKSQSLVLSGEIGMNFFLELPTDDYDFSGSYMTFRVGKNGPEQRADFDPEFMNSAKTRYGFTCYVKSIQMADTITATFHYGGGRTISKQYSVAKYIEFFEKNQSSFNAKTISLIHAIADFGHYGQIYLADVNSWTIGDSYAEMTRYYETDFDYAAILSAVESKAFAKELEGSKMTKATYKLHLDSTTTVDVYLTVEEGTEFSAWAEFGGTTYSPEVQEDGRYLIRIPDISAHQLGDMIEVYGYADGDFTVRVSALSYVRSVLKNAASNKAAKDGLSALYNYYAAVLAYRK